MIVETTATIAPNSIILGDCLEVMQDISDKSIDCIIADLPYGITACKWDSVIPFEPLWEQYKRIIKPNGAIALFGSQPFTSALVMSNPKWFKYEWIWEKTCATGFLDAKKKPLKNHENILIFYRNLPTYIPQMTKGIAYSRTSNPNKTTIYGKKKPATTNNTGTRCPKTVLHFNNQNGNLFGDTQKATTHPTQKPVALYEYLAKTYTLENELILDNAAGSGTLAIACLNTDRRYICIEKDPDYFEVMRNRIENHDRNAPTIPKKTRKPPRAAIGQLELF